MSRYNFRESETKWQRKGVVVPNRNVGVVA
jgi:hypothetical protein